ncbi:MAG: PrsW family intramembrane metalloprotease [Candidatus Saccharimonadales bacterium]
MLLTLISILLFAGTSAFLVWFLLHGDRGSKEPRSALVGAFGFGLVACVFAIWAELFLPNPGSPLLSIKTLLLVSLAVGIIEESAKFVPLALFIRNKTYFNEHSDGVIYFAIVGLTFGLVENLSYLLFYNHRLGGSQLTGIFRLIILFFFHAASTGIVGYYLAKAKLHKKSIWQPVIALMILMVVHGGYDFMFFYTAHAYLTNPYLSGDAAALVVMAMVGGLIISALLNTFLFLYYGRARQWDYSVGLAIDPKPPHQPSGQAAAAVSTPTTQS